MRYRFSLLSETCHTSQPSYRFLISILLRQAEGTRYQLLGRLRPIRYDIGAAISALARCP